MCSKKVTGRSVPYEPNARCARKSPGVCPASRGRRGRRWRGFPEAASKGNIGDRPLRRGLSEARGSLRGEVLSRSGKNSFQWFQTTRACGGPKRPIVQRRRLATGSGSKGDRRQVAAPAERRPTRSAWMAALLPSPTTPRPISARYASASTRREASSVSRLPAASTRSVKQDLQQTAPMARPSSNGLATRSCTPFLYGAILGERDLQDAQAKAVRAGRGGSVLQVRIAGCESAALNPGSPRGGCHTPSRPG